MAGQWLCFEAETLAGSFAPLLKMIRDAQGIRAHTVDLSEEALITVFDGEAIQVLGLLEVPEDLRQLKKEVRELMLCANLDVVPAWLGEFVHLEMLRLDGYGEYTDAFNGTVPAALGDLQSLTALRLTGFNQDETLPASMERLMSLKNLHLQECATLQELPCLNDSRRCRS